MLPMECECMEWGVEHLTDVFLGNGHHLKCEHFRPNVGALKLLRELLAGIDHWADRRGGVPEELWEAYKQAYFICRSAFPPESKQRH